MVLYRGNIEIERKRGENGRLERERERKEGNGTVKRENRRFERDQGEQS